MPDHRSNPIADATKHYVVLLACFVFLLLGGCMGQEPCSAEVKLLLAPGNANAVAQAFVAGQPGTGRVFLYDTETRDLLAHGVILRVRQGARSSDLTVKLRVPEKKAIAGNSGHRERFKCEVDRAGDTSAYSYSVQAKLKKTVPETGAELYQRLSTSQHQLLEQAGLAIDWSSVKRVADIHSTAWTITNQPPFDKLDLELWEWPGGSVLELSTKSDSASLQTTYDQLRSLAAGKGLALNSTQQFKTEMVLRKASN